VTTPERNTRGVANGVTPQLAALAFPFLPADPRRRGVVVEAGPDWRYDPTAVSPDTDIVVWGRLPQGAAAAGALGRPAAAREIALRTLRRALPDGISVAAVHRLAPRGMSGGPRGAIRAALRGGALVELTSRAGAARILDAVAEAAGAAALEGEIYAGSGGAVLVRARLVDGSPIILRVARAGTPGDPAAVADELERLAAAGVSLAPQLVGRGTACGASWVAETALPGRRPPKVTALIARQVADACARFPRAGGPPTALVADLHGAAGRLPERADALRRLAGDVAAALEDLPAVLRHGDLWCGNLLVDHGRLAGMIDWDAAHPSGVPGADLVQLLGNEARRSARRHLGQGFLARPWRATAFRTLTEEYWRVLGIAPKLAVLDVAGLAWWATEVHHTLMRLPHRATDEHWIVTNVDSVLSGLGY
jgi:phosphotransferase family enzyme